MLDGVYLTLLIGPLQAPVSAPQSVMEALQSVQVTAGRDRTGFQLTFTLGKRSPLQVMLAAASLDPMVTRVVISVTLRGMPNVICDGVVTQQAVAPSNEPGQATLTLTGEDLSVLMDLEQKRTSYQSMTDQTIVNFILNQYTMYGIVPSVLPPLVDSPRNSQDGPIYQTTTDLTFIRGLSQNCGYTFYVEPGPAPLQSLAYFGPDARLPIPQPALTINSDWNTNVESLSFSLNGLSKQMTVIKILDPTTKKTPISIPLPSLDLLAPPLGARITPPAKLRYAEDMVNLTTEEAAQRAYGLMREGANPISGNGSLNVMRYGQILRARLLVGVRGAGPAYDGLYYVESVTHNLKRGEYKQNFTLARDGLISPTPLLPVMP